MTSTTATPTPAPTAPRPRHAARTPGKRAAAGAPAAKVAAAVDPVARIAVEVSLPHLDRPFDYLVPEQLEASAVVGSRVRVRFAGQLVDGFVLERSAGTEHTGRLAFVERSVSPEVVLTPEVSRLARATADRWAGTLADVLRLAVPPRHADAEARRPTSVPAVAPVERPTERATTTAGESAWARYGSGRQLLTALRGGRSPRAVWPALPGPDWPAEIAELVAATMTSGRGSVVVVPDARDVQRVDAALAARLGAGQHVVLTADLGPAERYRRFLRVSRGEVRAVVGTRAAAFAPVHNLGLVVVWDDGDDLHAEPRAPYPHVREVLILRAHLANAAAVVGGHAVTAEGARLVATGWAKFVAPSRAEIKARAPLVRPGDDPAAARQPSGGGRLPTLAWEAAHTALTSGRPVLIQVPRRGYLPALSCDSCRTPLRCPTCAGPLATSDAGSAPSCRWCGRIATGWECPECGSRRFRATVVGARRTAEELGRAFPGFVVRTSAQGQVLDRVAASPSLVIATPGAEPVAEGGYGAALLLDGWALLSRADLRAGEEALRRWLNAAALVRPASDGGRVVVLADSSLRAVQALVRFDPVGHAERELAERVALGFPPAVTFAELSGAPDAVADLIVATVLPADSDLLGPVPVASRRGSDDGEQVRTLVRVPRSGAAALATALHEAQGVRSARKASPVRVRIDPVDIG
ncbi:MAG TPA: primosomal protein N' [Acidothermaceae bacterium]|nr:primosomal protein N' [Acidothermaceae bacterium]